MDRNGPTQTLPPEVAGTSPEQVPGPTSEPRRQKPYTRPRLVEHGRLTTLTSGPAPGSPIIKSDRNVKERFETVDPRAVLAAVATLPIERWSYKGEAVRHLGPMAQDFAAAFGLGADDRHIFPLDAAGVALAAIQGLQALVRTQATRLEALERELTAVRDETAALRAALDLREAEPVF
jgi:Chaperone of endosialidase